MNARGHFLSQATILLTVLQVALVFILLPAGVPRAPATEPARTVPFPAIEAANVSLAPLVGLNELADCNSNGVPDGADIAAGTSADINDNGIPDECEPDCNTNGIPDDADIAAGTSYDWNESGIPDECEPIAYVNANVDTSGINNGASWQTAYPDLEQALAWARGNPPVKEIWVAAGTYIPSRVPPGSCVGDDECLAHNARFSIRGGLRLVGGFSGCETAIEQRDIASNETILSGDRLGDDGPEFTNMDDNFWHIVSFDTADWPWKVILDGFTIRGGNTPYGGSGLVPFGEENEVRNCRFVGNESAGGRVVSTLLCYRTLFVDCVFEDNRAGAAIYEPHGSDSRIVSCVFKDNVVGTGVYSYRSDMVVVQSRFINNSGSAIRIVSYAPSISDSLFVGNGSQVGGAICVTDAIGRNVAAPAWPVVTNCTFFGNVAQETGGAVFVSGGGQTTLRNCILWGNSDASGDGEPAQITNLDGSVIVEHSAVQGWTGALGGVGNIGADPLFVDPDGLDDILGTPDDDLRIGFGSPCIDAGSNGAVPPDTFDLDGDGDTAEPTSFDIANKPRFVDDPHTPDTGLGAPPIVDMGAHEYQVDCNLNGVRDELDIAGGTSMDCDANNLPDECQRDCDGDGVIDACDQCGDLDGDIDVDSLDYDAFRAAYARTSSDPAYLSCADIDDDGVIGLRDYRAWLECYRSFVGE